MRIAGIMSGTSLDGIDVAVIDMERTRFDVIAHRITAYPKEIRRRLLAVSNAEAHVREISRLNFELAGLYAKAVRHCGVDTGSIDLVGCHGQTIFHERQSTLQLGDGPALAEMIGRPVVSNFRTRDMAAGGRGAPLVPYVDYLLFRHARRGRVALNIGGIANVTLLPPGGSAGDVIAFDTGPGNMIVDALVILQSDGKLRYDRGGRLAAQGHVNERLLQKLLKWPYYRERPPKTAGREQYGRELISSLLSTGLPILDLIATATVLTVAAIAAGIERFAAFQVDEVIVSGGGAHNRQMLGYLQAFLPGTRVMRSDEMGIDVDAKEAIAFAVLAYETWNRRPSNLPSATGAREAVILGEVSY